MAEGRKNKGEAGDTRRAGRLLLVGWDGSDPNALKSLLEAGRLPHLKSLIDSGVTLQLTAPRPRFPQAAWTSLATGKRPHEHGILHAFKSGGGCSVRPLLASDRRCSALWNVLGRSELKCHIVGWPVTHPAESFPGICVSDYFARGQPNASDSLISGPSVAPSAAWQVFHERSMTSHQVEDITLSQLLPSHVVGSSEYSRIDAACRDILAQTATIFRSIRWCLNTPDWDFAACVFPGIRRCHDLASSLRGLSPSYAELCDPMVAGCYEHYDLLLGQLLSQLSDDSYVMVVSPTTNALTADSESDLVQGSSSTHSAGANCGLAVICGPEVRSQPAAMPRNLLDIAPTILALLGVPYGRDMAGRPLTELFVGGLYSQTVETWDTLSPPENFQLEGVSTGHTEGAACHTSPGGEAQYLEELGYVDPLEVAAREAAVHCERTAQLNSVISLMDSGSHAKAAEVARRLAEEYPHCQNCRSMLAEMEYRAGRYRAAREQIDWLTSRGYENPHLYLLSAAIRIAERQYDRALDEISCAWRGTAVPSGAHFLVGSVYLRKGNFAAAEKAFREALGSGMRSAAALDGMASVKLHLNQHEAAAAFALDALEVDMRLAKAHYHLAVALYFLHKPQEALQAFASWATLDPNAAAPYRWMARVHLVLLKDPQHAESCLERGRQVIRLRRIRNRVPAEGTSEPISAR